MSDERQPLFEPITDPFYTERAYLPKHFRCTVCGRLLGKLRVSLMHHGMIHLRRGEAIRTNKGQRKPFYQASRNPKAKVSE